MTGDAMKGRNELLSEMRECALRGESILELLNQYKAIYTPANKLRDMDEYAERLLHSLDDYEILSIPSVQEEFSSHIGYSAPSVDIFIAEKIYETYFYKHKDNRKELLPSFG